MCQTASNLKLLHLVTFPTFEFVLTEQTEQASIRSKQHNVACTRHTVGGPHSAPIFRAAPIRKNVYI